MYTRLDSSLGYITTGSTAPAATSTFAAVKDLSL